MARSLTETDQNQVRRMTGAVDWGWPDLPHVDSLECWCDPFLEPTPIEGFFSLIHHCPTIQ